MQEARRQVNAACDTYAGAGRGAGCRKEASSHIIQKRNVIATFPPDNFVSLYWNKLLVYCLLVLGYKQDCPLRKAYCRSYSYNISIYITALVNLSHTYISTSIPNI